MSRLLSANFSRLFKSRVFRLALLLEVALAVYIDMSRYLDIKKNPAFYNQLGDAYKCADGFAFSSGMYIMFFAAVVIGSFIGTEYSDGTIRNKLMVGHKRGAVYLSNFIVCTAASLIVFLVFLVVILGLGRLLFTASYLSIGEIISYIFSNCLTFVAISAILVLLSMLIHSKAAGSVTVLITVMIFLFSALIIQDRLNAREYYEGYEITATDEETGTPVLEQVREKNPHYITGTKRQVFQTLYDALPACQFLQTSEEHSDKIIVMGAYSLAISVVFTGAGVLLFLKKDLK